MATHKLHTEQETFYFVTFTCYKWISLIEKTNLYDYFPFWVDKVTEKGAKLCGYVIMPNHIHLLVYFKNEKIPLNKVFSEGKRFMAYEIVKRLKNHNNPELLKVLADGVKPQERKNGKLHQVFRLSFDAKECRGENEINAVLDYIHHNPVSGKWNLADNFIDYKWSSAGFYEENRNNDVQLYDYRSIFD